MNAPCLNGKNKLEPYEIGTAIYTGCLVQKQKLASTINKSMGDSCVALHDAGIAPSSVYRVHAF